LFGLQRSERAMTVKAHSRSKSSFGAGSAVAGIG
jgi:hypothetical protein